MNEENYENSEIIEESEVLRQSEKTHPLAKSKLPYIIGGLILLSVFVILIWLYLGRDSGGKVVLAPRDVSFNEPTEGKNALNAGEQKIELSDDQLKAANLKMITVGEGLSQVSKQTSATGVVQPNDYKETPVISQVGGVIQRVNAELGQFVRAGQTIAVVRSNELASAESELLTKRAAVNEAEKAYQRSIKLTDIASESRNEIDNAAAEVKIAEAKLAEDKSEFERMRKLVGIGAVSRENFEIATTDLRTAEAKVIEAKNRLERAKKLLEINPARRAEQDAALKQLQTANAELASMKQRLLVLGLPLQRVNSLNSPNQISSELPIVSPVSGTVTMRQINEGETIMANAELLKVTNLSTVWVIGQVYEKDLASMRTGSGASVTTDAFTGEIFRGNVSYIDPNLDQNTRTAQVRIELPNAGEKLKIGMYVNIAFATIGGSENTVPMIPKEAVQNINGQQIVFAATDNPNIFLLKSVKIGVESDGMFPVLEGLFVSDKVVTDGSFMLRAEWQKTNPNNL
jgi:RND family efflux transporter MFP subunit